MEVEVNIANRALAFAGKLEHDARMAAAKSDRSMKNPRVHDSGLGLLLLSITTACNLRCKYCYADSGDLGRHMSWSEAKRAINLMAGCFDRFKIQFSGGEPLLNMGLVERSVSYVREEGLRASCQIQTNATLIDSRMAERLKRLGIGVGVSLDGPPAVNDRMRPFLKGGGSTRSALRGIENLGCAGVRVGVTCVLSRYNADSLPQLVDILSYLGNVEGIAIDLLRPAGRGRMEMQPDPAVASKSIEAAIRRSDDLAGMGGPGVKFREIERMVSLLQKEQERCYRCYFDACRSVLVVPGGEAYVCPSMLQPEFRLGNVTEEDFESQLPERMIRARSWINAPNECRECRDRPLCGGPCLAFQNTGSDLAVECAIKRTFINHSRKIASKSENDTAAYLSRL